jgi:Flp pilus assembly pilin Flp
LVEYALILSLVALVVIVALFLVGRGTGNVFREVEQGMQGTLEAEVTEVALSTAEVTGTPEMTLMPEERVTPTPEDPGRENEEFFYDDFDPDIETEWEWHEVGWNKDWVLEDGSYVGGANGGGEYRTFAGAESWTDYVVEVKANLLQGSGYGIYFRATDPEAVDAYVFQYDENYGAGAFIVRKVENGSEQSPIGVTWAPEDYNWYNQDRVVTVRVQGDTFVASIDGEPVLTTSDPSFVSGGVGLRTWASTIASFDYVKVTPLESPVP